ncbi:Protein of unknown function, partial [Gryllus bimaculatus]
NRTSPATGYLVVRFVCISILLIRLEHSDETNLYTANVGGHSLIEKVRIKPISSLAVHVSEI